MVCTGQSVLIAGDLNADPAVIPCLANGISAVKFVDLALAYSLGAGTKPDLALFFSPSCCQAHMLGILDGMVQMDSYVVRFWCLWCRLQKTVESPQLQSIKVVDFFFVVHRPIPMVFATMEIPQLHVDMVVVSLVAGRALLPCRDHAS